MIHRHRRTAATLLAVGSVSLLADCGASSSSGSGSGSGTGSGTGSAGAARPAGFTLTASQQLCLKQHGVTLGGGHGFGNRPAGAGAQGGPSSGSSHGSPSSGSSHGSPPSGSSHGSPPSGSKRPTGAFGHPGAHGTFPQAGSKFAAAFKACGVSTPSGSRGGGQSTTAG